MNQKKTIYKLWAAGEIGNFGSFQTYIFDAYRIADLENMAKLEAAFPYWFVAPCNNPSTK